MRQITDFINEKLHIKSGMTPDSPDEDENFYGITIEVKDITDLIIPKNKKVVARYLKGTNRVKSLKILMNGINVHVHRYCYHMHELEITAVATNFRKWPDEEIWKHAKKLVDIDDKQKMDDLFDAFYDFIKEKVLNSK